MRMLSRRNRRVTSNPSTKGIITSRTMMSNSWSCAARKAAAAIVAHEDGVALVLELLADVVRDFAIVIRQQNPHARKRSSKVPR